MMVDRDEEERSLWGRIVVYTIFYGTALAFAIWGLVSIVLQVFWPESYPPP